ncbi:hypothetical protein AUK11_03160 [bacterium CG2_30_37_16]|nr:MAG: hypothetical protein AUK11_03160 [bacterium CG2_30_37_16]PIP30227.1 MAG: hypothetical protein COX25_05750 [bacterium (Candidatus Howlettbacteria) CG23_combo_of_CG06-09_8_20_14_all_37_9]PIY00201.1 MAG: hypothetical protein COZ22_00875 [bacterium (Candidatus Howlettbacteria) CG_4_10_14_3_um_filter_37_10]PJB07243.1 MAG: hypothetical protein CO123_00615 [bacterium (Candidatus Howlettbacteria) CG_4_9_14_3_um_filter_37_10]
MKKLKSLLSIIEISLAITIFLIILSIPPVFEQIKSLFKIISVALYGAQERNNISLQIIAYFSIFIFWYFLISLLQMLILKINFERENIKIKKDHEALLEE